MCGTFFSTTPYPDRGRLAVHLCDDVFAAYAVVIKKQRALDLFQGNRGVPDAECIIIQLHLAGDLYRSVPSMQRQAQVQVQFRISRRAYTVNESTVGISERTFAQFSKHRSQ